MLNICKIYGSKTTHIYVYIYYIYIYTYTIYTPDPKAVRFTGIMLGGLTRLEEDRKRTRLERTNPEEVPKELFTDIMSREGADNQI